MFCEKKRCWRFGREIAFAPCGSYRLCRRCEARLLAITKIEALRTQATQDATHVAGAITALRQPIDKPLDMYLRSLSTLDEARYGNESAGRREILAWLLRRGD